MPIRVRKNTARFLFSRRVAELAENAHIFPLFFLCAPAPLREMLFSFLSPAEPQSPQGTPFYISQILCVLCAPARACFSFFYPFVLAQRR